MTLMEKQAYLARIKELPTGNITYKTISGKKYLYLQWTENGRQHSRRVKDDERIPLQAAIQERKRLQALVKQDADTQRKEKRKDQSAISACIRTGKELQAFVSPVIRMRKREIFPQLHNFLEEDITDKVFILCGLQRTGKTTMIRQAIAAMNEGMFSRTAYIQVTASTTFSQLYQDLKKLEKKGFRYLFLDEITRMEDFPEGAGLLSDVFATSGIKIVLSGRDSLKFLFAQSRQLYGRSIVLHASPIPYREYTQLFGLQHISEYLRYGGTLCIFGSLYSTPTFENQKTTEEYIDTAVAQNIHHSLQNHPQSRHFLALFTLNESDELTDTIHKTIRELNRTYTQELLVRTHAPDPRYSAILKQLQELLEDQFAETQNSPDSTADNCNVQHTSNSGSTASNSSNITINNNTSYNPQPIIKEYLDQIGLTYDLPVIHTQDYNLKDNRTILTQPGMQYVQAEALITRLLDDNAFRAFSVWDRQGAKNQILSTLEERMLEDTILLETSQAKKDARVFRLQFEDGAFDMVISSPSSLSCEIFLIRNTMTFTPEDALILRDTKKCSETANRFGTIQKKTVLYLGPTQYYQGIHFLNADTYLKSLTFLQSASSS